MSNLSLHFDGACEPYNGPGGYMVWAWIIESGSTILKHGTDIRPPKIGNTNNVAEYFALGCGLRAVRELVEVQRHLPAMLMVRGDSMLVIEQMLDRWECRSSHLQRIRERCQQILIDLNEQYDGDGRWVKLEHIPREQNAIADQMCRDAYYKATGRRMPDRGRERMRV